MQLGIDHQTARLDARLVAFELGNGFLNQHRLLSQALGLKPVATLVWLTVAVASVQRYMRRNPRDLAYRGAVPLPDDLAGAISRRAIARATGLPAETVRRSVAGLVDQGLLEVLPSQKLRTPPGTVGTLAPAQIDAILAVVAHQASALAQAGVLRPQRGALEPGGIAVSP
jgi:uncharacterized protein YqgV (UPF0045/DUF77 family)